MRHGTPREIHVKLMKKENEIGLAVNSQGSNEKCRFAFLARVIWWCLCSSAVNAGQFQLVRQDGYFEMLRKNNTGDDLAYVRHEERPGGSGPQCSLARLDLFPCRYAQSDPCPSSECELAITHTLLEVPP